MSRLVLLSLCLAGCVPLSYAFTPSSSQPIRAKPKGCDFDFHTAPPPDGYEEIGILEHYNGDPPKRAEPMEKAIAQQVCEVGGDAVIAAPDDKGRYSKATIIRYVR